jgi:CheY-like chemotaxis protein
MDELPSILLAEDDATDVLLLRRAFKEAGVQNPLHVCRDGQEAIDFLAQERRPVDRLPALTILDLKMPRRNGMEVLRWIRGQPLLCGLPVMIFSSSAHHGDIEQAYDLSANSFIVKPPSIVERRELAVFIGQWLRFNQPPLVCTEGVGAAQALIASRNARTQSPASGGRPGA